MIEDVRLFLEREKQLRIGRRIGRGGFAEVYEASTPEGVRCAIKVSLDPLDENNPAISRELENLRLVMTVSGHPHLVSLMDYWVVAGYLVTRWELADGGSLLDRLQQCSPGGIPLVELLQYISDAAEGIDFLNLQRGVYHRDIKPANLLLFQGRVKIGDLGLIKFAGASTASHSGIGTAGYLPPEAFDRGRVTPTVDLYGLAASYLHLRTGRLPFGDNPAEIVIRQLSGEPLTEGLEKEEAALVRRALSPRPEQRPQKGARQWVLDLQQSLRSVVRGTRDKPLLSANHRQVHHATRIAKPPLTGRSVYALSVDGRILLSAFSDKVATIWDVSTGQRVHSLKPLEGLASGAWCTSVAKWVVISPAGGSAMIRDVEDGRIVTVLDGSAGGIANFAFTLDGRYVLGPWNKSVALWSPNTGLVAYRLRGHLQSPVCCAIAADGKIAFIGCGDGGVIFWGLAESRQSFRVGGRGVAVTCGDLSVEGLALVGYADGALFLWDLKAAKLVREFPGGGSPVRACCLCPESWELAAGYEDGQATVWDIHSGQILRRLKTGRASVAFCKLIDRGRLCLIGLANHQAQLWDVVTGQPIRVMVGETI